MGLWVYSITRQQGLLQQVSAQNSGATYGTPNQRQPDL